MTVVFGGGLNADVTLDNITIKTVNTVLTVW